VDLLPPVRPATDLLRAPDRACVRRASLRDHLLSFLQGSGTDGPFTINFCHASSEKVLKGFMCVTLNIYSNNKAFYFHCCILKIEIKFKITIRQKLARRRAHLSRSLVEGDTFKTRVRRLVLSVLNVDEDAVVCRCSSLLTVSPTSKAREKKTHSSLLGSFVSSNIKLRASWIF
jgi:hypothetical protein